MTYYAHTTTTRGMSFAGFATRFMGAVAHAVTFPARARRRYVAIRHLEQFDDHLLHDIGVERDKIRNAVFGRRWTRHEIRIPYDIVIEMSPAAKEWVRRTSPANGFADTGRSYTLSPIQSTPFGTWIARSSGNPNGRAGSPYAVSHQPQAALHSPSSPMLKSCRKVRWGLFTPGMISAILSPLSVQWS